MKQDVRVENAKWDAALRRDRLSAAREGVVKALERLIPASENWLDGLSDEGFYGDDEDALKNAQDALKEYHDATN